jgi:hypothetical protein
MPDADASTTPTAAVHARIAAESGTTKTPPPAPPENSKDFLLNCLAGNEHGDALLYEARAKPLYQAFCKWYSENVNSDRNPITVQKFGEEVVSRYPREKDRYGKFYSGLKICDHVNNCDQETF